MILDNAMRQANEVYVWKFMVSPLLILKWPGKSHC